jgi:hypothetical protein
MATSVVDILSARYQSRPQLVHLNLYGQFIISYCSYANMYFFELWPRCDLEVIFNHPIYLENK